MCQYTKIEQAYICSKVKRIKWSQISESLRKFWKEYRDNEILTKK
jgi:hypothetical protein